MAQIETWGEEEGRRIQFLRRLKSNRGFGRK
jgi:hypothetical protein